MTPMTVLIPVKCESTVHKRDGWIALEKRRADQRAAVRSAMWAACAPMRAQLHARQRKPLRVVVVRIAPGTLDTVNLAEACEPTRRGVTDALGGPDGAAWIFGQRKPRQWTSSRHMLAQTTIHTYAVEITISEAMP
jgi:hypothetical protein